MAVGGTPLMLPLTDDDNIIGQFAGLCDGFLFTGGQDVNPKLYNEASLPECGESCDIRDSMERKLLMSALEQDKAVLGICRGIQFINVILGGTLYQDLQVQKHSELEHHQTPPYDKPVHQVNVVKNTPLSDILLSDKISVNSYHHQAIKELADPLNLMAYAADGVIEAVYMPDRKFVWAVQWHPEFSYHVDENSRKILKEFVQMARMCEY